MEVKIMYSSGQKIDIESASMKEIKCKLICGVFDNELTLTKSKTDAIYNTSIVLDIGESTIYRALKERNGTDDGHL